MEKIDEPNNSIVTNGTLMWNDINWRKTTNKVQGLMHRIYRTTNDLNEILKTKRNKLPTINQLYRAKPVKRKLRSLQKLLFRSFSNILVSVRKVTQTNLGKNTSGIDKVTVKTPERRMKLAYTIQNCQKLIYTPKATLRIYIPKINGDKRGLGIPTIYDRCIQNMVKNSLEPHWETNFEGSSYGFRPCRSTYDAIGKIYSIARPNKTKKYILDADISKCFDEISHHELLKQLKGFPMIKHIENWLKAGIIDDNVFKKTNKGTPQGGVISPLLANIALHGLESHLGIKFNNRGEIRGSRALVRYADDFVVFCESREDALVAKKEANAFFKSRGLHLSEAKTEVKHISQGFDFLGFNVSQYTDSTSKTGYKLLIKPSKESIKRVKTKIKSIFKSNISKPLDLLIKEINYLIRGWANYYNKVVSSKVFSGLDNYLFIREVRYVKRHHPNKPTKWTSKKYWGRFNQSRNDKWTFGNKRNGNHIIKFQWFKIKRHTLIKGKSSPFDSSLKEYFIERRKKSSSDESQKYNKKWQNIAKRQNYICPHCSQTLFNDEITNVHHIKPRHLGGSNKTDNLVILHYFCHQAQHKTRQNLLE